MRIGILGSGVVGQTLGAKLAERGEDVVLGTRTPAELEAKRGRSPSLGDWLRGVRGKARVATFADAAAHGEIVINATSGEGSLAALRQAGEGNLTGKVLLDVANPLDFSRGMPPSLTVCNTDSLGEQIQRAFPQARVVKALNTTNAGVMVDPARVGGGDHHIFVCGNDATARAQAADLLRRWFGWREVIDLGDITASRGLEMILPLWVRLMSVLGTAAFNFKIVRNAP